MDHIAWDNDYAIGVDLIDQQHKKFIKQLNDLHVAIENSNEPEKAAEALKFFTEYAQYHFGTEEKNMRSSRYPKMAEHLAKHQEFRNALARITQDFERDGSSAKLASDVMMLLFYWFINHILDIDKEFGAYLTKNNFEIVE